MIDPRKVLIITGHHNWIVAAYAHYVICYRSSASDWLLNSFDSHLVIKCSLVN